jgi:hypothetical protein
VEQRVTGPGEIIRPDNPKSTLVSVADVRFEDEVIGSIRSFQFEDEPKTVVHQVRDHLDRVVGHVTDDGRAYRRTAHEGDILVSQSTRLHVNVATILGRPLDRVHVVEDGRIIE